MNILIRGLSVCVVVGLVVSASAQTCTMKAVNGHVDWTDPNNWEDGIAPKGAGDTVTFHTGWIAGYGYQNFTNTSADAESLAIIRELDGIEFPYGVKWTLDLDEDLTISCPVKGNGTLVKAGPAVLSLTTHVPTVSGSSVIYYDLNNGFSVMGGTLRLPVADDETYRTHSYKSVYVAEGATLVTVRNGNMSVTSFSGAGMITNETEYAGTYPQLTAAGMADTDPSVFYGSIGGPLMVRSQGSKVSLRSASNTFTGGVQLNRYEEYAEKDGGVMEAVKLGKSGEPSSFGTGAISISSKGGLVRYIGDTDDECNRQFSIPEVVNIIDAGHHGGLKLTGVLTPYSSTETLNQLYLTGSNSVPCEFAGEIRTINRKSDGASLPVYVTKQGTGTWNFTDPKKGSTPYYTFGPRGVFAVENGTLGFDTLAEAGTWCALGWATNLYSREVTSPSPAGEVDYAYLLGGTNAAGIATEGRMRYTGTADAYCSTRPIALRTAGALDIGTSRFKFFDVSPEGTGAKSFALEADAGGSGELRDITDSAEAPVSIVKRGAGSWRLHATGGLHGGVSVEGGELIVENPSGNSPFTWFRLTLKETVAGSPRYADYTGSVLKNCNLNSTDKRINLCEFALFDVNGVRQNIGIVDCPSAAFAQPGECALENPGLVYEYYKDATAYCLFDNRKQTAAGNWCGGMRMTLRTQLDADDESTWFPIVFRLTNGAPEVVSWDLVSAECLTNFLGSADAKVAAQQQVSAIRIEGSLDGKNWENLGDYDLDLSETVNYAWHSNKNGWGTGQTTPRKLSDGKSIALEHTRSAVAQVPWLTLPSVEVAKGASLKFIGERPTVSALTLDVAGAGTIENVAFAEAGVLTISGEIPKGKAVNIPVGLVNVTGWAENVSKWIVRFESKPDLKREVLIGENGVTILPNGMMILLR